MHDKLYHHSRLRQYVAAGLCLGLAMHADLGHLVGVCIHPCGVHLVARQLLNSLTQPCMQQAVNQQTPQGGMECCSGHELHPDTAVDALLVQDIHAAFRILYIECSCTMVLTLNSKCAEDAERQICRCLEHSVQPSTTMQLWKDSSLMHKNTFQHHHSDQIMTHRL